MKIRQPVEANIHPLAWKCFCKEMEGRQYGKNETSDAWLWFLAGWVAGFRNEKPGTVKS